jgi:hypothetical protein
MVANRQSYISSSEGPVSWSRVREANRKDPKFGCLNLGNKAGFRGFHHIKRIKEAIEPRR